MNSINYLRKGDTNFTQTLSDIRGGANIFQHNLRSCYYHDTKTRQRHCGGGEMYSSITLKSIDAKLNKMLANESQHLYMKYVYIHDDQEGFIPKVQGYLNIH